MNGLEIRAKIRENNKKIEEALRTFILKDDINKYLDENQKLREKCEHIFENGICIYCDLPEEFEK